MVTTDTKFIGSLKAVESLKEKVEVLPDRHIHNALIFFSPSQAHADIFFRLYYRCLFGLVLEEGEYTIMDTFDALTQP